MKKLIFILALAMLFLAVGCRKDEAPANDGFGDQSNAEGAEAFEYNTNLGGVEITSYAGDSDVMTIPGEIDGKPVVAIGEAAFYENTFVELIIPDSVDTIGRMAFHSCPELQSVIIPDSVTSIGENAFWNCRKLTATYKGETYYAVPTGVGSYYNLPREFYDAVNNQ